ncbi:hypothetical protein [Dactylosporangium sp. NPDC051484]|uniref:hypothetical protein n=1 Tax=Dactylosporangium sp. NPDC051484 TaxID=3154942 RepID=UPI0034506112
MGEPSGRPLAGALHRLHAPEAVWPPLALAVVSPVKSSDDWTGPVLTGLAMRLISPFAWVYHLMRELPAAPMPLERRRWVAAVVLAVLALRLVWLVPALILLTLAGVVLLEALPREPPPPRPPANPRDIGRSSAAALLSSPCVRTRRADRQQSSDVFGSPT